MAYPPSPLPANYTDASPATPNAHAGYHNLVETAVNDIVAVLGVAPADDEATVTAKMSALDLALAGKAETAGEDLAVGTVCGVRADGRITALDPTVLADRSLAPLVTTADVLEDESVVVVGFGSVVNPAWDWTPGVPLFLGAGGVLTEVVPSFPSSAFSRLIGTSVTPSEVFVDPDPSVVLSAGSPPSGGGGGGTVAVLNRNGIARNVDLGDLVGVSAVFVDASSFEWAAGLEVATTLVYGGAVAAWVHPTNGGSPNYVAYDICREVSGDVEPTWVEGSVFDGAMEWSGGFSLYISWQPTSPLAGSVVASGFRFISNEAGLSGGAEPDWTAAPNPNDTILDGAITWTNYGPCTPWAPNTAYSFVGHPDQVNFPGIYTQTNVIPSDAVPDDGSFVFIGQPDGQRFGFTAATEPDGWDNPALVGTGAVFMDGDIMWNETETGGPTNPALVLTGIVAPSGPASVTFAHVATAGGLQIVLEDAELVESDYSAAAASDSANGFTFREANLTIDRTQMATIAYYNDEWHIVVPAT